MRAHWLAPALVAVYRLLGCGRRWRLGRALLAVVIRLEGGPHFSLTARRIMKRFHDIEIGSYSRSGCFDPAMFSPGTRIGRYCSIARGIRAYGRNHPIDRLSTNAMFYDERLGLVDRTLLPDATKLEIGHDVWIGAGAIILPGCARIGNGAVIGANAVVTKDVPDYAIVGGNPAKVIRLRFPPETIGLLKRARWWERPLRDCQVTIDAMTRPLGDDPRSHPLLRDAVADAVAAPNAPAESSVQAAEVNA